MARSVKAPAESKSAKFIRLIEAGATIAQVAKDTGSNYAFVYGVAKKAGLAGTAARRRAVRAVQTDDSGLIITVALTGAGAGFVEINRETGKVRRHK